MKCHFALITMEKSTEEVQENRKIIRQTSQTNEYWKQMEAKQGLLDGRVLFVPFCFNIPFFRLSNKLKEIRCQFHQHFTSEFFVQTWFRQSTVKLAYNDHGYNELTVIANKINILVWFGIFYQWNFMLITNTFSQNHGYNEQNKNKIEIKILKIWFNFKGFNKMKSC